MEFLRVFHDDSKKQSLAADRLFHFADYRKSYPVYPSILGILIQTIKLR